VIEVRAPLPGDLETIGRDAAEEWVRDKFRVGADFSHLIAKPHTHVATISNHPVAVGGFIDREHGAAFAWSVLGQVPQSSFVELVRVFRRQIKASPYRLVEAHCINAFSQAHRWVRILGFEPIHGERCFTPDGREFSRFIFRNDHGA
jgi:hypothetical protein